LGDNISGGAVLLLPIRLHNAGIFIAIGLLCVNIYRWLYLTQLRFEQNSACAESFRIQMLNKLGSACKESKHQTLEA